MAVSGSTTQAIAGAVRADRLDRQQALLEGR